MICILFNFYGSPGVRHQFPYYQLSLRGYAEAETDRFHRSVHGGKLSHVMMQLTYSSIL